MAGHNPGSRIDLGDHRESAVRRGELLEARAHPRPESVIPSGLRERGDARGQVPARRRRYRVRARSPSAAEGCRCTPAPGRPARCCRPPRRRPARPPRQGRGCRSGCRRSGRCPFSATAHLAGSGSAPGAVWLKSSEKPPARTGTGAGVGMGTGTGTGTGTPPGRSEGWIGAPPGYCRLAVGTHVQRPEQDSGGVVTAQAAPSKSSSSRKGTVTGFRCRPSGLLFLSLSPAVPYAGSSNGSRITACMIARATGIQ